MTRLRWRTVAVLAPLLALTVSFPASAQEWFGRNKVQYQTFQWKILKSEHFDNFFYPAESTTVHDAARMAERWYARHSDTFRHAFDRKSLVFYADHEDFEQTNVISDQLDQGIEGVTEPLRTRVIMPFEGPYFDDNHVLGHELVHVFQYNIAEGTPGGGIMRMDALPGWLIEGMAEYLSLGRESPLTTMWMRDAVERNKFPTIKQVTNDPQFFPYRYGQALWAYIGGRWGDRSVVDVYRASLRLGWDAALVRVLGENQDSLSKDWAAANRALFLPQLAGRTNPDSTGDKIVGLGSNGEFNVSPSISPDGKLFAFYRSGISNLYGVDLLMGDAATGHIIKKLAGPASDPHFDALNFVNASGDWSPDASKFAFIANAEGRSEVAIVDARSTNIERRIKLAGIGEVSSVAWSPDGHSLALSGLAGGVSDLYLLDLDHETVRQLTNDKYADMQPAWSPDGKSIVFSTDRGPETDFNALRFSPLQLATYDLATGHISVFSPFAHGKSINPQYSPDGQNIFFVSDQDGIADVYRLNIASGQLFRVTHTATGVSGITEESPTLSVSRQTGRMLFTTFYDQGNEIRRFEAPETVGTPVTPATLADGAMLPPSDVQHSLIMGYLADATTGLPTGGDFQVIPYHSSFSLDEVGQPSLGVVAGGPFGTGVAGGVSMLFGDQLSDRQIFAAVQANGTVKDIGGALEYANNRSRWNYGVGLEHIPYLTGGVFVDNATINEGGVLVPGYTVEEVLQRIYIDQASAYTQYPLSTTRRLELSGSITHLGYDTQLLEDTYDDNGFFVNETLKDTTNLYTPVWYAGPSIALVGDNSFEAFTSPVMGERFRFQYSPTFGSVRYDQAIADYRRYFFVRPVTVAFRGLSMGRYGGGAEDPNATYPFYLGDETLIRGYGYGSFTPDECSTGTGSGTGAATTAAQCPAFSRLFGSKVGVFNAELRIPVLGVQGFGLINFPYLPMEVAPFFDAGVSYTNDQSPDWRITTTANNLPASCANSTTAPTNSTLALEQAYYPCADRIPVFSTGVTFRFNVMGYAILEAYMAHPFQRPTKSWVWGFQLAPGW
jgi:Tol biopolymer transport system component